MHGTLTHFRCAVRDSGSTMREPQPEPLMVNRRDFFGITLGAGATLALTPELLRALQQSGGKLIQRAIPSSGERLPLIGLGLAHHAGCADPAALQEGLKPCDD